MPNAAKIMQVAACVLNGNARAIVKALKSLKSNVRGPVEDVNKVVLLMVVTCSGVCGACAASHVVEELKFAIVHAAIPRPQTAEKVAADRAELNNHEDVTNSAAQFAGILWMTVTAIRRRKAALTIQSFDSIVS